jgi:hypothetical protein
VQTWRGTLFCHLIRKIAVNESQPDPYIWMVSKKTILPRRSGKLRGPPSKVSKVKGPKMKGIAQNGNLEF